MLVAVIVYVVVTRGVTLLVPPGTVTVPIALSIDRDVAPVELQVSVEAEPSLMVAGLAVKVTVGIEAPTVTVANAVLLPTAFVAVIVYVVDTTGVTLLVPPGTVTVPIP